MIDKTTWELNRDQLLASAGLLAFADHHAILQELKQLLADKYESVNQRFDDQLNPYLSFNKNDRYHVKTPALDEKQMEYIANLLDQSGQVPILDVLSEVNNATQVTRCFTHHNIKNAKRYSPQEVCMAGIIGLGCNIGVPKMGQISAGVNANTLQTTVNWYFSRKALDDANKQIGGSNPETKPALS